MTGAGEILIGFGTAFEDPRFAASGPPGQKVGGAEDEHFPESFLTGPRAPLGGDGVLPVADGVEGAFEAQLVERGAVLPGALEQDAPDQVVGDGVQEQFAPDHARSQAAHARSLHGGFDVVEVELDPPAARLEGGEGFHGPEHGVEQGGDEQEGLGAKAGPDDLHAHLAHGDEGGQPLPEPGAHHPAGVFVRRAPQGDEAISLAEALASAPVDALGVASAHEEVDTELGQQGEVGKAPEAPIGDEDVAPAQGAAQEGKEARFAGFPAPVGGAQEGAAAQAEEARLIDQRPAAAGFLTFGLGPFLLIVRGVGSGD